MNIVYVYKNDFIVLIFGFEYSLVIFIFIPQLINIILLN